MCRAVQTFKPVLTPVGSALTALQDVADEYNRAIEKYGPFASNHEGYAVLLKEMDELWEEIKKKHPNPDLIRHEAKQVAAMALRIMVELGSDDQPF